jgi:hypothetical protein
MIAHDEHTISTESDPNFVLRWWPHTLSKLRMKLKAKMKMIHMKKKDQSGFLT